MADAVEKLIQSLQDDLQWQSDLAAVLENKLDAMRHYDMSRLEALTLSEQRLTQAIAVNERKRREAIRQATEQLLGPRQESLVPASQVRTRGENVRPVTARELASALDAPRRERLLTLSGMLREMAEKVQRLNRVNALASEKVMGHFEQIFTIIAQSGRDIGLYGRGGKKSLLEQNRLVDARA